MACHTPPLKKAKKQGEMPLPSLSFIQFKKVEFIYRDGMGLRLGYGISPCFLFLRFFERLSITDYPKISYFSEKILLPSYIVY